MPDFNNKAMYKLSYGLFVCTATRGDKKNGCIINTAVQVASDPNTISIAVNKANYTHDMIMDTKTCNISVISTEATFDLFKHFGFQSGRDVDKFAADYAPDNYAIADNGIPYITNGTRMIPGAALFTFLLWLSFPAYTPSQCALPLLFPQRRR